MDYLSHNIAVNLKRIRTSKWMSLDVDAEQKVAVRPASGAKCARCWKVLTSVGTVAGHDTLCPRCAAVVKALPVVE